MFSEVKLTAAKAAESICKQLHSLKTIPLFRVFIEPLSMTLLSGFTFNWVLPIETVGIASLTMDITTEVEDF